jgi:hypothetical protein
MQIRLSSEKFRGACNGGRAIGSHSGLIGWETRHPAVKHPRNNDQEQWPFLKGNCLVSSNFTSLFAWKISKRAFEKSSFSERNQAFSLEWQGKLCSKKLIIICTSLNSCFSENALNIGWFFAISNDDRNIEYLKILTCLHFDFLSENRDERSHEDRTSCGYMTETWSVRIVSTNDASPNRPYHHLLFLCA